MEGPSSTIAVRVSRYPAHYPALVLDPLFWVVDQNEAYRNLLGPVQRGEHLIDAFKRLGPESVGMHLIDVCLVDLSFVANEGREYFIESNAPLASVRRAIGYFDAYTADFGQATHPLRDAYHATLEHLSRIVPAFEEVRSSVKHTKRPLSSGDDRYFVTGTVHLAKFMRKNNFIWPLAILRLDAVVPRPDSDQIEQAEAGKPLYELTLVPQNPESEATIILTGLLGRAVPIAEEFARKPQVNDLAWMAAAVKTLGDGLSRGGADRDWILSEAFDRYSIELKRGLDQVGHGGEAAAFLEAEIRLQLCGPMRRAVAGWFRHHANETNVRTDKVAIDKSTSHIIDIIRATVYDDEFIKEVIGRATYGSDAMFEHLPRGRGDDALKAPRDELAPSGTEPERPSGAKQGESTAPYPGVFQEAFAPILAREGRKVFSRRPAAMNRERSSSTTSFSEEFRKRFEPALGREMAKYVKRDWPGPG